MLPEYLGQTWVSYGYELLLAIYAQFAGFGFAGLFRKFLIYPSACIWPTVLPKLALNRALVRNYQKEEVVNGWRMSRLKFFSLAFFGMFIWYWGKSKAKDFAESQIPNNFFTALQ